MCSRFRYILLCFAISSAAVVHKVPESKCMIFFFPENFFSTTQYLIGQACKVIISEQEKRACKMCGVNSKQFFVCLIFYLHTRRLCVCKK